MGQQFNKVQKRARRERYIERKKAALHKLLKTAKKK